MAMISALLTFSLIHSVSCQDPQHELILNHRNTANGCFSRNLSLTGLENPRDSTSNTYSIIGEFDIIKRRNYLINGAYHFKLVYEYPDGDADILIWSQTAWITEAINSLDGFGSDLSSIPDQTDIKEIDRFYGLGTSSDPECYLDGSSVYKSNWWSAVGVNTLWNDGIPGFKYKIANGQSLYILNPKPANKNIFQKEDMSIFRIHTQQIENILVTELQDLENIIKQRSEYMNSQEINVYNMIKKSDKAYLLWDSYRAALTQEREILGQIMDVQNMVDFLKGILLIENLFNKEYTAQQRQLQQSARMQHAKSIQLYENKKHPLSNVDSFIDLLIAALNAQRAFEKFVNTVEEECKRSNLKIISSTKVDNKGMERAFSKTFYDYYGKYENGHQHMTDVLRTSIVFDDFEDLYQCYAIIESLSKQNRGEGILRVKDRLNVKDIPFGYRDLLINIRCPGSRIVCEIQLHHQLFYKHKDISHELYKKARLFEVESGNLAYNFAIKHYKDQIGEKIYEYSIIIPVKVMVAHELLKEWGFGDYAPVLIDDKGYDDVEYWKILTFAELKGMNFKDGHARKFMDKARNL